MAVNQMPSGTHRRGMGERPYSSYSIFKLDGDKEVELGITRRTDGGWIGETKSGKSGVLKVHRDAVEWIVGSKPVAPKPAAKKPAPKDSTVPEKASAPKAQPEPKSELTKQLAKTVS